MPWALLASAFVIATCGLVYELLAGTLASYLLGDSVTQFSTVIGAYLFSMGIGAFLSQWISQGLVRRFVEVEILVGLVGGCSTALLFVAFPMVASFRFLLYGLVILIGILVGLEIPLLMRILKDRLEFKDVVAQVLTMDYVGALAASLLFPLFLVPHLGLVRTGFLFGMANAAVALWTARLFRTEIRGARILQAQAGFVMALLGAGMYFSQEITSLAEGNLFSDEPVLSKSTPYQRIVLTRRQDDLRLFLNAHLQFSSRDEYRYHEALVHPVLAAVAHPHRILILGGGDGLAAREVLKHPEVVSIVLVDLDPEMTRLFSTHPLLTALNAGALTDPRTTVMNADAFVWLERSEGLFDAVLVDFPDPSNYSVGKLYTTAFYRLLRRRLAPGGAAAVQSTSPLFARRAFWCIVETAQAAGLKTLPYHAYVPSFGEWGYVLLSEEVMTVPPRFPEGLRFLNADVLPSLFSFSPDMGPVPSEPNRLDNQLLVRLYEDEWRKITGGE